jgi:hypothetical protein
MAVATGCLDELLAGGIGGSSPALTISMWRSMTGPGWPMWRPWLTSRARPRLASRPERWPGAGLGIQVERVLTDNGWCYRSQPFQQVLAQAGAAHRRTRPYRPQTNGKAERFHRNPVEPVDPRLHRGTSTQPLPFPAHILYVP